MTHTDSSVQLVPGSATCSTVTEEGMRETGTEGELYVEHVSDLMVWANPTVRGIQQ